MAYNHLGSGIQISLTGNDSTWQSLTDHNRAPIQISTEIIESQSRMANGSMRKYVIAQKKKISVSWKYVPSKTSESVDGLNSAAWLEWFYQANAGVPVYIKVVSSEIDSTPTAGSLPSGTFATAQTRLNSSTSATGATKYKVFMTDFSKTIINRTQISDYVDMSIEFTEI